MKCLSCQSLFVHSRKHFQLLLLRQISFESVLFGTREEWCAVHKFLEIAAFVAEQVDLLETLLLLEFADGNLEQHELLLMLLAVENDAKRRLLLPI